MKLMFASDPKLTSVVLSVFNTSVVTDMMGMFMDDSSLTSLNVSNFVNSNVTDMSYMFAINDTFNPDNKLDAMTLQN